MNSLARWLAPEHACGYLPDRLARLEYERVTVLDPAGYGSRLLQGWRRFGRALFRPRCRACTECRALRVDVDRFRPNRSQRRACRANERSIRLKIGKPRCMADTLALYERYHRSQASLKGWPEIDIDEQEYRDAFVDNPFRTEEWRFELDGELVGVGYVDDLPIALSAIYFFHAPEHRHRSLGTWNILRLISAARDRGLPHLYLGYYVASCPSLAYKARFAPNQVLGLDGNWRDFAT
jgi:arginine-tRNA-protein transferase